MVLLDASTHKGPYTITASLAAERASINDVLFGDVWLCSVWQAERVKTSMKYTLLTRYLHVTNVLVTC